MIHGGPLARLSKTIKVHVCVRNLVLTNIITDLGIMSSLSEDMSKAIFGHEIKTRIGIQLVRKVKSSVLTGVAP